MDADKAQLIVDLSNEELEDLGFLGPGECLSMHLTRSKERPKPFRKLRTTLDTQTTFHPSPPSSPISPARDVTAFSLSSDTTVVGPDPASAFEQAFFYKGVSEEHPCLLQRSDVRSRPFLQRPLEDQHTAIPGRTAHGVFDPILVPGLWRQQFGPAIVNLLAETKRNIHVSMIVPVRFSIPDDEESPSSTSTSSLTACEANVVNDLAGSSWEVAIFNFTRENFSYKGDSGSCIFNAEGKMVTFLHSGMPRGMSSHVTFGTPAHFVLDHIRKRYPYADFNRGTFFDVPA
ncbi:hypothetical protein OE88DRAFT_1809129 [Heliocybe sulcata]|uniref:Uncharacterized protein n=1 Tax=Heliocybe sulcata TaxID=5364 RepID=A0A5C3MXS4_9AGAM|nr:hypothetical protein OE88DRAFT_1809129 [Heliocybe sulcata]